MDYGGANDNQSKAKPGASKQKRVKFLLVHDTAENQDSSDTLSSSSPDSSSDDFFQVNPKILPKFTVKNKPPLSNGGTKPFFEDDDIDVSSEALYRLEESINGSPGSTSQFSDITHESLMPQFSPTQSPPIQIMEKNGGFDPNRIPNSIFSKSSTPTEWSVASNDSLFSIRIGESSFSRDHVVKFDLDLKKSGELLKHGELPKPPKRSGELVRFRPTSPTYKGIEPYFDIEKTISEDVKLEGIQMVDKRINDGLKDGPMNQHVDTIIIESRNSYGASFHPGKSEIRVQPFVKPIKKKSSSCLLCHCHDCCQAFWGCKWLTCSCKWLCWPSCSFKWCINCFTWPSCRCKCLNLSSCCCKCPNLSSCCKCPNWSSCCCKCPNWSSCCCKCPNWSSCCCKCPNWSSCCCKCPNWSSCCCKCPNLSSCCCKCPNWSSCCCKCPNLSSCCCKCPNWSSCCCKCPNWSSCCCKCPNWSSCCCKCPNWSSFCCKCSSLSCFKCSSWSICKCGCSNCTWICCYCWNRERKRSSYDSSIILADGGITNFKSSTKASSRRNCFCFSCSSSCSCCSCLSCSCCY